MICKTIYVIYIFLSFANISLQSGFITHLVQDAVLSLKTRNYVFYYFRAIFICHCFWRFFLFSPFSSSVKYLLDLLMLSSMNLDLSSIISLFHTMRYWGNNLCLPILPQLCLIYFSTQKCRKFKKISTYMCANMYIL